MIEIWGKTQCPYCEQAKQFCETRQYNYVYKQLDVDFTREEVLEAFPGARTFPQIKVNGDIVGGFDKLASYIENTNYNGTGHTL
jgi:glutaredoxin 3